MGKDAGRMPFDFAQDQPALRNVQFRSKGNGEVPNTQVERRYLGHPQRRKKKDLTQRTQREEHRGHGEEEAMT